MLTYGLVGALVMFALSVKMLLQLCKAPCLSLLACTAWRGVCSLDYYVDLGLAVDLTHVCDSGDFRACNWSEEALFLPFVPAPPPPPTPAPPPLLPGPDIALAANGGRILPEFTSATSGSRSDLHLWLRDWLLGYPLRNLHLTPPRNVLHGTLSPGICWKFKGSSGRLGVKLGKKTQISGVSLPFPETTVLSLDALATAPRAVTVWGLTDDEAVLSHISDSNRSVLLLQELRAQSRALSQWVKDFRETQTSKFVPLVTLEFNVSSPPHFFPIQSSLQDVYENSFFDTIIFDFESNWGGNRTCIYQVSVHSLI